MAKPIDLFYDWLSLFVKLASEAQEGELIYSVIG